MDMNLFQIPLLSIDGLLHYFHVKKLLAAL